jgi:two-component system KDP operon response regulator KdpE
VAATVLIADDDPDILELVARLLQRAGHDVVRARDGQEALQALWERRPDLVILDIGMPKLGGWQVLERIREVSRVPVLMLTAEGEELDRVRGLTSGADDFVTKPFDMDELAARVRSLLRRSEPENVTGPVIPVGHHLVDLAARTVKRAPGAPVEAPESVRLTRTEWAVLEILLRHPGRLVSGKQLLAHVWGTEHEPEGSYLRFYLARLRQKLEPEPSSPRQLLTEPGMGYRFQPKESAGDP